MKNNSLERRKFTRFLLDWPVNIIFNNENWPAMLIDLSLKGALLNCENINLKINDNVTVVIQIPQAPFNLTFKANVIRSNNSAYALLTDSIDLEDATILRRIIELNMGNQDLLLRDMENLLKVK